ncbi:MAG TPA: potassium transporter KefB [Gammaproteobacteria bacterium]|nr:potassium transporter KefB [Gammaproteobacteria bacterium]
MEEFHELTPVLILLLAGILAIVLSRPLRLSPIVGFLVAGVLIGPHGAGWIVESKTTQLLSELGVVFLLFDIGLHFSLAHLWDARRDILGLGPAQVVLSTLVFGGIAVFMDFPPAVALIIGATLALSSTAVAIRTMAEHHQQHSPVGASATAVLIFQDISAIFLLILAGTLGPHDASVAQAIGFAAAKALLALLTAIVAGRFLIAPLFRLVARSRDEELFTAVALLLVLATAVATGVLALSLTLGAFLAGMVIAETPYRHLVQTETKPFRGLLLGFFFITVGMLLNLPVILGNWAIILVSALLLVSLKTLIVFITARVLHSSSQSAFQMGVLLSQGSEFAFVIFALPAMRLALGDEIRAVLVSTVAVSMALTPLLVSLGHRIANRLADRDWRESHDQSPAEQPGSETPVMIIGMGEIGQRVADGLTAHDIPYRAIEADHDQFVQASAEGYSVAFGDATDLRLMETIKLAHADTIAVTFADYPIARRLHPLVRQRYPRLRQLVAVESLKDKKRFDDLGMQAVYQQSFPPGLDLAAAVLKTQGIDDKRIGAWMRRQQEIELEALPAHELDESPAESVVATPDPG